MPNPLTTADIEDVLGSIRRLVSEEAAAKGRKAGESERLVLTPALRVHHDEAPKSGPLKLGGSVGSALVRDALAAELDALEASVSRKAAQWREEEPGGAPVPAAAANGTAVAPGSGGDRPDRAAPDNVARFPFEDADFLSAGAGADALPADAFVVSVADVPPAAEAEDEAAIDAETFAPAAGGFDEEEEEDAALAAALEDAAAAKAPEPAEDTAAGPAAEPADDWEPAGEGGRPVFRNHAGGVAALQEPPIEAELVRLNAAPQPPATKAPDDVALPEADGFLDEAELRALVADVLREELKGPLGERITRNVRKLVRREIAQALSSMEID